MEYEANSSQELTLAPVDLDHDHSVQESASNIMNSEQLQAAGIVLLSLIGLLLICAVCNCCLLCKLKRKEREYRHVKGIDDTL